MKDIPFFHTENGIAGLTLSQIPYRREAYARLRSVSRFDLFVEECVGFCKACGAQRVYGAGAVELARFPLETAIWTMQARKDCLPAVEACLWPVVPENVGRWREIYNRKMAAVPHAALLSQWDEAELLRSGSYFVHRDGRLLGIGRVKEDALLAVAAELPGTGGVLVGTLASVMPGDIIRLEVASANLPAVRLYERLGFVKTGEVDRWYQIG